MMPPSTFTVAVFNVVVVVVVVVVMVVVVVVVVVEVVVANFVIDFFVVATETNVVPEVEETFLLRGLGGGVIRIEGRTLCFPSLGLVGTLVVCSPDIS